MLNNDKVADFINRPLTKELYTASSKYSLEVWRATVRRWPRENDMKFRLMVHAAGNGIIISSTKKRNEHHLLAFAWARCNGPDDSGKTLIAVSLYDTISLSCKIRCWWSADDFDGGLCRIIKSPQKPCDETSFRYEEAGSHSLGRNISMMNEILYRASVRRCRAPWCISGTIQRRWRKAFYASFCRHASISRAVTLAS